MSRLINPKTLFIIATAGLLITFFFYDSSDSIFDQTIEPLTPANWDEVDFRNIVKNSIPIVLLEETTSGKCKVSVDNFDNIIEHRYFVKGDQLADELGYDPDEATLFVLCDQLVGEKSRLNIWYATEEAGKHSTKYTYFITEWTEDIN